MISLTSRIAKVIYSFVASILIILIWKNVNIVPDALNIPSTSLGYRLIGDLICILASLAFTAVVVKPKHVFSLLGLDKNILKGFGIAFLCVIPLFIGFLIFGSFNTDITFSVILKKCILAGFKEEVIFRAFMFGLLFRYAKTGFIWAVILPALYFGMAHLYQGHDIISALAAFGITFLGAIYFSWMYVEWNFNLWLPIGLHTLMNASWVLFYMEGTEVAAGGLLSNIIRLTSILLAIIITIWHKKRNHTQIFKYPIRQF